jgi:transcriptional regulator with XRE-family HTH domain
LTQISKEARLLTVPKLPKLKQLRNEAALSQMELAERSGVSRATIADLEAGNRGAQPRTLRKLAGALRASPADLMRDD